MSLFASFKDKLTGSVQKLSGNKDFLEAVCASAALVASADGDISDSEVTATTTTVSNNATLCKAFKQVEIERTLDVMLKRAKGGRSGRAGLYREIEQVAASPDMAETVYLCALDVAETDGSVGTAERSALNEIARKLGVNPSNYANV